jgi:hypothetical protein
MEDSSILEEIDSEIEKVAKQTKQEQTVLKNKKRSV